MAWPCITRACCINRVWTELDKGDIAVPLVFTKYSDVAEVQHLNPQPRPFISQKLVTTENQPVHGVLVEASPRAAHADAAAASSSSSSPSFQDVSGASVMREDFKAWSVRPERSCKPRDEYQLSKAPFSNVTQYQKDYKPWPIPKKGDHPWIPKHGAAVQPKAESKSSKPEQDTTDADTGVEKCEVEEKHHEKESKEKRKATNQVAAVDGNKRSAADALNRQIKQEVTSGSSYRTEFKAYADVKRVKPTKAKSHYKILTEEKTNLETSYSATYKGEQVKLLATDNKLMDRRRIRSLYSQPSKESSKVERPIASLSKQKKTTSHSKPVKKTKENLITSQKKKPPLSLQEPKPEVGVSKKSKEMINRLAEAKD